MNEISENENTSENERENKNKKQKTTLLSRTTVVHKNEQYVLKSPGYRERLLELCRKVTHPWESILLKVKLNDTDYVALAKLLHHLKQQYEAKWGSENSGQFGAKVQQKQIVATCNSCGKKRIVAANVPADSFVCRNNLEIDVLFADCEVPEEPMKVTKNSIKKNGCFFDFASNFIFHYSRATLFNIYKINNLSTAQKESISLGYCGYLSLLAHASEVSKKPVHPQFVDGTGWISSGCQMYGNPAKKNKCPPEFLVNILLRHNEIINTGGVVFFPLHVDNSGPMVCEELKLTGELSTIIGSQIEWPNKKYSCVIVDFISVLPSTTTDQQTFSMYVTKLLLEAKKLLFDWSIMVTIGQSYYLGENYFDFTTELKQLCQSVALLSTGPAFSGCIPISTTPSQQKLQNKTDPISDFQLCVWKKPPSKAKSKVKEIYSSNSVCPPTYDCYSMNGGQTWLDIPWQKVPISLGNEQLTKQIFHCCSTNFLKITEVLTRKEHTSIMRELQRSRWTVCFVGDPIRLPARHLENFFARNLGEIALIVSNQDKPSKIGRKRTHKTQQLNQESAVAATMEKLGKLLRMNHLRKYNTAEVIYYRSQSSNHSSVFEEEQWEHIGADREFIDTLPDGMSIHKDGSQVRWKFDIQQPNSWPVATLCLGQKSMITFFCNCEHTQHIVNLVLDDNSAYSFDSDISHKKIILHALSAEQQSSYSIVCRDMKNQQDVPELSVRYAKEVAVVPSDGSYFPSPECIVGAMIQKPVHNKLWTDINTDIVLCSNYSNVFSIKDRFIPYTEALKLLNLHVHTQSSVSGTQALGAVSLYMSSAELNTIQSTDFIIYRTLDNNNATLLQTAYTKKQLLRIFISSSLLPNFTIGNPYIEWYSNCYIHYYQIRDNEYKEFYLRSSPAISNNNNECPCCIISNQPSSSLGSPSSISSPK